MNIGIIGAGNIGLAVAKTLSRAGIADRRIDRRARVVVEIDRSHLPTAE
jgi:Trk K+ transport system NAD-binding subunit